jgi:hypothetical protein
MDVQTLLNIAFGVAGAMCMWVLNSLKDSLKSLHDSDEALTEKVQKIELLVTGVYVKKDEMDRIAAALFVKLDKIDGKLDNKADKSTCDAIHFKGVRHE